MHNPRSCSSIHLYAYYSSCCVLYLFAAVKLLWWYENVYRVICIWITYMSDMYCFTLGTTLLANNPHTSMNFSIQVLMYTTHWSLQFVCRWSYFILAYYYLAALVGPHDWLWELIFNKKRPKAYIHRCTVA